MKKKVLFVITKSNWGGAQRYVFDLATSLSPADFDVIVAFGPAPAPVRDATKATSSPYKQVSNGAGGHPGQLSKMLLEKSIRTILIPELGRDIRLADDWRAFRALVGLFKAERPDIVHLNSSKAGGLGALAARLARIPRSIFTSHGLAFDEKRPALQKILITLATWATILLAHATILISNDTFERARKMPFLRRKVHLVWNGIVSPLFLSKHDARKELRGLDPQMPEGTRWIGSVGELHPNKDYACAIDCAALLPEDTHLVIIGDGEEREALLARAKEKGVGRRMHLLGFIPDAAKYLRAFDVFVLPSQKEGLPYVLLEAGLAYIPVVASDTAGVKDIILDGFTGLLVPPHDTHALASALERAFGDATLARSLKDELLKRVQQTFSFEKMMEKTIALYERGAH